jgi:hypothetical protein
LTSRRSDISCGQERLGACRQFLFERIAKRLQFSEFRLIAAALRDHGASSQRRSWFESIPDQQKSGCSRRLHLLFGNEIGWLPGGTSEHFENRKEEVALRRFAALNFIE